MLRGMYTSISAMVNLQSSQTVITNNIANVNTTGFKEERLMSKTFDDVLISNNDRYSNGVGHYQELGTLNFGVKIDEIKTNFKVNRDGYLVTSSGYSVLNSNNQPIYVGNSSVSVDTNNNVVLSSGAVHRFNIVDFQDYNSLNKVGSNLYTGEGATATNNYIVKNMQIEGSNVDIIQSTADLMSNLRAFEANQKVVQIMDSTLSKIANEIGTVR